MLLDHFRSSSRMIWCELTATFAQAQVIMSQPDVPKIGFAARPVGRVTIFNY
jgi:hypothetical protein